MQHARPREAVYSIHNDFRHNYFSNSSVKSSVRQVHEQVVKDMAAELERVPTSKLHVLSSLDTLTKGEPLSSSLATELFNTLIYCEAYTVFVEAFATWTEAMRIGKPDPSGQAFVSTLTLELPAEWDPQRTVALQQAFQQIRVDRVEVLAPVCRTFEHLDHLDPMEPSMAVPEAVNGCLVELIKGGATELCVRGTLNVHSIDRVSAAVIGSTLASIDIDPQMEATSGWASSDMQSSFSSLLKGTLWCGTLKRLILRHRELENMYGEYARSPALPRGGHAVELVLHADGALAGQGSLQQAVLTRLSQDVDPSTYAHASTLTTLAHTTTTTTTTSATDTTMTTGAMKGSPSDGTQ